MPYKEHPAFDEPNDNTVWRYLDFSQFIKLLETESLWFTRTDQFSDPYEGIFPARAMQSLVENKKKSIENLRELVEDGLVSEEQIEHILDTDPTESTFDNLDLFRRMSFINCWHMSEYESMAMWKANLTSVEGVVIRSTFSRLKNALDPDGVHDYYLGTLNYIDFFNDDIREEVDNMYRAYVYKQQEYEFEKEVRAVIGQLPETEQDDLSPGDAPTHKWDEHPPGFPVKVDLGELIEAIYISPISPSWHDKKFFESILCTYELDKQIETSILDVTPEEMLNDG